MFDQLIIQFNQQTGWEALAVILGITYVILAARESVWCWPAAFFSTGIFTVLFWQGQLPMQSVLKLFYLIMAVYGFMLWRRNQQTIDHVKIHFWPWRYHLLFILIGVSVGWLFAEMLIYYNASQQPYLEAFVTIFAVINTYLVVRKVVENWIYWVIIDSAAIVLYLQTGFVLTAVMMLLFVVLALYGLASWLKLYRQQNQSV